MSSKKYFSYKQNENKLNNIYIYKYVEMGEGQLEQRYDHCMTSWVGTNNFFDSGDNTPTLYQNL